MACLFGRGFSQAAQTSTDGYALRTKLTFDMVEKLRAIVLEDGAPDSSEDIPQTVSIVAPSGGESYPANTTQVIEWNASDNVGVSSVDLDLSINGGATYPTSIAADIPNTGSYAWTLPGISSTAARVRVTVRDTSYNTATSMSASDLSIEQLLPVPSRHVDGLSIIPLPNPTVGAERIEMSIPRAGGQAAQRGYTSCDSRVRIAPLSDVSL